MFLVISHLLSIIYFKKLCKRVQSTGMKKKSVLNTWKYLWKNGLTKIGNISINDIIIING